ncbi:MAG: DUF3102 domain-containing protein [Planctomycetota bacterium]|jgi:hypothetical protein
MNIEKNRINEILTLHNELSGLLKTSLHKAMRIGELLTQQKASLQHGQWLPWLEKNIPIKERTVQRYMLLHEYRERLKSDNVTDLISAHRLIQNLREFDKATGDYNLSSHKKKKIRSAITPDTNPATMEALIWEATPRKQKELLSDKHKAEEQRAYTENRLIEIKRLLDNAAMKCAVLKRAIDEYEKIDQIYGYEPRELQRSMKRLNIAYEGLAAYFSEDHIAEDEQSRKKTVD